MLKDYPYEVFNKTPMTMFNGVGGSKLFLVHTPEEWRAFYEVLMKQSRVSCDTETSGFKWYGGDKIVGMSFGWLDTHFYTPVRHVPSLTGGLVPAQLDMDELRPQLQEFFSRQDLETVWQNFKFDNHMYHADGIEIKTLVHDTRILWQLYDENAPGALKTIASGWRDIMGRWHKGLIGKDANAKEKEVSNWRAEEARARRKTLSALIIEKADELQSEPEYQSMNRTELKKHIKEVLFKDHEYAKSSKKDIHYGYIPLTLMTEYAALDTFLTGKLYDYIIRRMPLIGDTKALYENEMELSRVLFEAENAGMKCDRAYLENKSVEIAEKISTSEKKLIESLGDINLNSNDQLASALINKGVPLVEKTDAGKLKVDKKVLSKLKKKHEIVSDILDYRALVKIKNTYFDSLLEKMNEDNIIHPNFNQNVSTGRMSGSEPNMTNMPRGSLVRNIFTVPSSDYLYLLADYSQVEVRLTAHFSRDPILVEAYRTGQDVHTKTFCGMFGEDYDEAVKILKEEDKSNPRYNYLKSLRSIGKTLNFAMVYGSSPLGLSEQINPRPEQYADLDEEEWVEQCGEFMRQYFYVHLGVKRMIRKYSKIVEKEGRIITHFGRVRSLPHHNAVAIMNNPELFWMEKRAQRQGVNALIQGTAADLFKIAVVRIHKILKGTKSYLVNFVHDEVQIYLHKDDIHLVSKIKRAMEDFKFNVPIVADISISTDSWGNKVSI